MEPNTANRSATGTAVELRGLNLRAGPRLLLEAANARFEPGQITLIVGPSGAGKSLLLKVIAGLIGRRHSSVVVEGELQLDEKPVEFSGEGFAGVGVVFQSFALFDELSPLDNIRFAADHRTARDGESAAEVSARLLHEFSIPGDVRTALLSGGQRQRLAIARTLAYDPGVILYDEPTSGLDAATAAEVARLIQATHRAHGKTSIVVTHDDRALVPIADRVFLVDPASRSLREIPREQWPQVETLFEPLRFEPPPSGAKGRLHVGSWIRGGLKSVGDFFDTASRAAEQVLWFPVRLIPRWRSLPWGLKFLLHYLRLVVDPSAWLYIGAAGAIAGFTSTYFTLRFLPFRSYTEPLVIEDLLEALGFTIYRVFVPVLVTVLVAARCGAAVSSDVGGKVYGQQTDAMRTFGAHPARYLATNINFAFLVGTLLLVSIGFFTAKMASRAVFTVTHPNFGPSYWDYNFHEQLRNPGQWLYSGTDWLAAKVLVAAAGIATITYRRGMRPKYSTTDVSRGITSTVLWTTLYALLVHMAFALIEFEP